MWRFSRSIDGIRDACNALGIPVVSGNVSLYNETDGQAILPTPTVAVVGQLDSADDRVGMAFRSGTRIALYNRQMHLTTGPYGSTGYSPGGMMMFVRTT